MTKPDESAEGTTDGRRILVTGFGPFPGVGFNPSGHLIDMLRATPPDLPAGSVLMTETLPTVWQDAWPALRAHMQTHDPQVVIMFGFSARADGFTLETRAANGGTRVSRSPVANITAGYFTSSRTFCNGE